MKPLELRKQLLIAESELNRGQLVQEWQVMRAEVHALTAQAKTLRSVATAAAMLVAGLASCRRNAAATPAEKPSWLQTILEGAGVVGTFWSEFRARPKE